MGRPTDVYRGRVSLLIYCSFITLELRGEESRDLGFFLTIFFLAALVGMWEILVPQPGIEVLPPAV